MSTRIIISGRADVEEHSIEIRDVILDEYSGITESEIAINDDGMDASLAYAKLVGAIAVIRCFGDLNGYLIAAQNYYSYLQTFYAFISNSHIEEIKPYSIQSIITVGAGITANETAYGVGLEFWDEDADLVEPSLSSYSAPRVLAKILKIKDTLGCSWWEARYRARMTASENGVWSLNNGYGKPDADKAIAYTGVIPYDPYYDHNPSNEPMTRAGFRFK